MRGCLPVKVVHLQEGTFRFNELRRRVPGAMQRTLTNQLRELEMDGLIIRTVYAQVPPKVEYGLSDLVRSMVPVLGALKRWGDANIDRFGTVAARRWPPEPGAGLREASGRGLTVAASQPWTWLSG